MSDLLPATGVLSLLIAERTAHTTPLRRANQQAAARANSAQAGT